MIATLEAAAVPVGRIYTVADIAADPQYQARGMIVQTHDADGPPAQGARHRAQARRHAPAGLRTPAPKLGQHNDSVLGHEGWPARAANDEH